MLSEYIWLVLSKMSYSGDMEECHIYGRCCICVFVYLYLGSKRVVVGEWIVDVISFQKIFGLCDLKCHIMEIWRDVTLEDNDEQRTTNNGM